MAAAKLIKGDNLIYHFLRDLVEAEDQGQRVVPLSVIQDMLRVTGIWFPLNAYRRVPVLLPHVVRDISCRGNKSKGIPDEWNSPDERGFVRDDNSRLKGIPRSLAIKAPTEGRLRDSKMGSEFVASHIWRVTNEQKVLASRQPLLNSFIPNLVWLPRQISKLTDREGGIVQQTLQAMSWQIFRHAQVAPELAEVVEQAWSLLPPPSIEIQPMELGKLNWFVAPEAFIERRVTAIRKVRDALQYLETNGTVVPSFESRRYVEGVRFVPADVRRSLISHLDRFILPSGAHMISKLGHHDVLFRSIDDVMSYYEAETFSDLADLLDEGLPTTNRYAADITIEDESYFLVLGTLGIEMCFPMTHNDLMTLASELEDQIEELQARQELSDRMWGLVEEVPRYIDFTDDEIHDELMKGPPRGVGDLLMIGEEMALDALDGDRPDELTSAEIDARLASWRAPRSERPRAI